MVQLVNSSGTVVQEYQYDAFGVEYDPDANDTNYFRYSGQYFDVESGTYYLRARYYSPGNGRFTSEDPIRDGLNWYTYGSNNPIYYIDPTGLRTYIVNGINNSSGAEGPEYAREMQEKLEAEGVKDVRVVSIFQVKKADGTIENVINLLDGAGKVIGEMIGFTDISKAVSQIIQNDLDQQALSEGEQMNLIGYSGGGQIVLNTAEKLDGKVTINNVVLIGTPLLKLKIRNVEKVTMIWSDKDLLSWNITWGIECVKMPGVRHSGVNSYVGKNYIDQTIAIISARIK